MERIGLCCLRGAAPETPSGKSCSLRVESWSGSSDGGADVSRTSPLRSQESIKALTKEKYGSNVYT